MGVYEFDRAQLSARSCNCSSNGTADATVGETCIIAQKIFDQCRIQKCLTSAILGPARAGKNGCGCCDMLCEGEIIVPPANATDVTIRNLELTSIEILRKKANTLQNGCWDVDLKYTFRYELEFMGPNGCTIGCINAVSTYTMKVTLFGSTESDVTTTSDLYDCCGNSYGGPFVVAEGKAVALAAELKYPAANCNSCCCCCNNGCDNVSDANTPIAVNVTIGLFTIVKLFRTVNMLVNSLGRCVPNQCTALGSATDPCANFESMEFPMDAFSPTAEPRSCCGFGTAVSNSFCNAVESASESCNSCSNNNSCNSCNSCNRG